jgi:hypothetical protein
MEILKMTSWTGDWAWSFPLIALSVVIHVLGLGLFNERVVAPGVSPRAKPSHWGCPTGTPDRSVSHPYSERVSPTSRTQYCGPVRPVV